MDMEKYPEHIKLKKISAESQQIGEFLEWLGERGIHLARYNLADRLVGIRERKEALLASYFDIDEKKLEEEKQRMLEELRG